MPDRNIYSLTAAGVHSHMQSSTIGAAGGGAGSSDGTTSKVGGDDGGENAVGGLAEAMRVDINSLLPTAIVKHEKERGVFEQCAGTSRELADRLCSTIVDELERGIKEKDFHLRTRTAVHALQRHMDLWAPFLQLAFCGE